MHNTSIAHSTPSEHSQTQLSLKEKNMQGKDWHAGELLTKDIKLGARNESHWDEFEAGRTLATQLCLKKEKEKGRKYTVAMVSY